jgi:uncharacterized membrane protein
MVRFNKGHWILVLCISRMQKETRVSVAIIAKSATDLLVLYKEPSRFFFAGMAFTTTLIFEGTFASKKEDTDGIATLVVTVIVSRILMTIDTVRTSTTIAIFAHLHNLIGLFATTSSATILVSGLEMKSPIVVNIILSTSHGEDV